MVEIVGRDQKLGVLHAFLDRVASVRDDLDLNVGVRRLPRDYVQLHVEAPVVCRRTKHVHRDLSRPDLLNDVARALSERRHKGRHDRRIIDSNLHRRTGADRRHGPRM
jgi:hypothetical protein